MASETELISGSAVDYESKSGSAYSGTESEGSTDGSNSAAAAYGDIDGDSYAAAAKYTRATKTEYRSATESEYSHATETEYSDAAADEIMLTELIQNGDVYEVSTAREFTSAITSINKSTDGGIISLKSDISLSTGKKLDVKKKTQIFGNGHTLTTNCTLVVNKNTTLVLGKPDKSDTLTIKRSADASRSLVDVDGDSKSYLHMYWGVSLDGGNTSVNAAAVYIDDGLFILEGGTIENFKGKYAAVRADGGRFHMYEGTIRNCVGTYGAIEVDGRGAWFRMSGGLITDCGSVSDSVAGAVYSYENTEVNIESGTISNNKGSKAGAIYGYEDYIHICDGAVISSNTGTDAGAISLDEGFFTIYDHPELVMDGGVISQNEGEHAGGIYSYYDTVSKITINKGSISDNKGAGVWTNGGTKYKGQLTMNGGEISRNTVTKQPYGAGVYCFYTNFTMSGGSISGNILKAKNGYGGGVSLIKSTFTMSGGSISGNVSYKDGGGLGCEANSYWYSEVQIKSGEITDNTAYGNGGGIWNQHSSYYFTLEDGMITGNKAGAYGGGVYMDEIMNCPDFTDGFVICNNTAGEGGADLAFLKYKKGLKCSVRSMNATWHDTGIPLDGWFTDKQDARYVPSASAKPIPLSDMDKYKGSALYLAAGYELVKANVSYKYVGDVPAEAVLPGSRAVDKGTAFTADKPAELEDYYFSGWYTDSGLTTKFTDGSIISRDTILYGKWIKYYTVKYVFKSVNTEEKLPEAVSELLPSDNRKYRETELESIVMKRPSRTIVDTEDGSWRVTGYSTDIKDKAVIFTASWAYTKADKYGVGYSFKSKPEGVKLPAEVNTLLPSDSASYKNGTRIIAKQPAETEVTTAGGEHWRFMGYDAESKIISGAGVEFTGTWQRTYGASYSFVSGTGGRTLPDEVTELKPEDDNRYITGTRIKPEAPLHNTVAVDGGTWSFRGYTPSEATVADADVSFTGSWEFTEETKYSAGYIFVSRDSSILLPDEVRAYIPKDGKSYEDGDTATAIAPKETTVRTADGTGSWSFSAEPAPEGKITVSYRFTGDVPEEAVLPESDVVESGTAYSAREISTVDGYSFRGWYLDKSCTISFTDGTKLNKSVTLYGRWIKKSEPEPVIPGGGDTRNRGSNAAGYGSEGSTGRTGWYKDTSAGDARGVWYYYDENGALVKGWHLDAQDGRWYYLSLADGHMLTGWQLINGKWYYLNPTAPAQTWEYDGSRWVYNGSASRPYGSMYAGELTPDSFIVGTDGAWKADR